MLVMTWVLATFFITMAFSGNLKSNFARKAFEEPTKTINEIVDKDMTIHVPKVYHDYLLSPDGHDRQDVMKRVLCQATKRNSFYPG